MGIYLKSDQWHLIAVTLIYAGYIIVHVTVHAPSESLIISIKLNIFGLAALFPSGKRGFLNDHIKRSSWQHRDPRVEKTVNPNCLEHYKIRVLCNQL